MKLDFKNLGTFELPSEYCKNTREAASCYALCNGKLERFTVRLYDKPSHRDYKPEAKLAFLMAAKIINHFDPEAKIEADAFKLPRGGHMVQLCEFNSYGDNAEFSKRRVNKGLKDIAGFEFYLRHALLAYEHCLHDKKLSPKKQMLCPT